MINTLSLDPLYPSEFESFAVPGMAIVGGRPHPAGIVLGVVWFSPPSGPRHKPTEF